MMNVEATDCSILRVNYFVFYLLILIRVPHDYNFPRTNDKLFSFPLEEFIYNYLITLSFYIIPKKGV